jgi:hypothetical protein
MTDKIRPAGKMPDKPLSCDILVEIWRQKLNGEKKFLSGETRKWLRCKIKELTR